MRLFGVQFLGQGVTFVYLTKAAQQMPGFSAIYGRNFRFIISWSPISGRSTGSALPWTGRGRRRSTAMFSPIAHERAGDILSLIK